MFLAGGLMPAVHIPQDDDTLPRYKELAGRVEAQGYDRIWVGEVNDVDAVSSATLAAIGTEQARIGVFLNVFTRAPGTLAMTASTLARLARGRAEIALGVGSPLFVDAWNGIPYRQLHARLRDTFHFLRAALAGERVRESFETFRSDGFALAVAPDPPPSLLIAATGPRALELAAKEADGVVLNWIRPDDLERVEPLPQDRGAVSLVVPMCPTPDRDVMDRTMRSIVATYLHVPAYAQQQRRLGRDAALEPMWAAWETGDRAAARAALPSDVLDAHIVWGEPAACRARLADIERQTGARVIATVFPQPGTTFEEVTLLPATP
jgi:probable F420-dependent oxidoreductase